MGQYREYGEIMGTTIMGYIGVYYDSLHVRINISLLVLSSS